MVVACFFLRSPFAMGTGPILIRALCLIKNREIQGLLPGLLGLCMYMILDIMYIGDGMTLPASTRKNKHLVLDQAKLKKAQRVLGARTETETIERALDQVIDEDEKNRRAWAGHDRFIKTAIRKKLQIQDVFGRLDEK